MEHSLYGEKALGSHFVKKFPALYESEMFNTAATRVRHLSLSWDTSNQAIPQTIFEHLFAYHTAIKA
jgi:hypothetical protein